MPATPPTLAEALELLRQWREADRSKCQAKLAWRTDEFLARAAESES